MVSLSLFFESGQWNVTLLYTAPPQAASGGNDGANSEVGSCGANTYVCPSKVLCCYFMIQRYTKKL